MIFQKQDKAIWEFLVTNKFLRQKQKMALYPKAMILKYFILTLSSFKI